MKAAALSTSISGSIKIRSCGHESCKPLHSYGPAVRDYYLIHVVQSGCGVLENEYGRFPVTAGQGFLIFPQEVTVYTADRKTPWVYDWVGFSGTLAQALMEMIGVSRQNPVIPLGAYGAGATEILRDIDRDILALDLHEMAAAGGVLRLFAWIRQSLRQEARPQPVTVSQSYFQKAQWFMEANLQRDLKITEVAAFVGLSRSQLFRIVVENSGIPPKRLLLAMRLTRAEALLKNTDLPLKAVALSSGFSGAARMGNVFKSETGKTPTMIRRG